MDHPVDFVKKLICPMTITSSGPICPCPCLTVSSLARPASPLSGLLRYTTNLANYNFGGNNLSYCTLFGFRQHWKVFPPCVTTVHLMWTPSTFWSKVQLVGTRPPVSNTVPCSTFDFCAQGFMHNCFKPVPLFAIFWQFLKGKYS